MTFQRQHCSAFEEEQIYYSYVAEEALSSKQDTDFERISEPVITWGSGKKQALTFYPYSSARPHTLDERPTTAEHVKRLLTLQTTTLSSASSRSKLDKAEANYQPRKSIKHVISISMASTGGGNDVAASMKSSESKSTTPAERSTGEDSSKIQPSTAATAKIAKKNHNVTNVVRVGVGVIVQDPLNTNKIFCGIRKGSHGSGTLSLPGGHLELYETWENCAYREVFEEMNIKLNKSTLSLCYVSNDPMPQESKHYITIFIMGKQQKSQKQKQDDGHGDGNDGEYYYPRPMNMEPNKCEGWDSYTIQELKEKQDTLFGPLQRLLEADPLSLHQFLSSSSLQE